MKINREWNIGVLFLVSIALSALLTPVLYLYYDSFFNVAGSWLIPSEAESISLTFALLFSLFFTFLYSGLYKNANIKTAIMFLVFPFLLVAAAGTDRLLLFSVLVATGSILGRWIHKS